MSNEQKLREALQQLHEVMRESMGTGGWVPSPLHSSFMHAMIDAKEALALPITPPAAAPAPAVPQDYPVLPESVCAAIERCKNMPGNPSVWVDMMRAMRTALGSSPAAPSQPVTLTEGQIREIEDSIWIPHCMDDTEREANREFLSKAIAAMLKKGGL